MVPFFSIGITTYDRQKMLGEAIASILEQTFSDFEIIISNDNPKRKISKQSLEINDPRIRCINQPKNLGEVKNMNFLLKASKGKYFTWLADDDLYNLGFLKAVHQAIVKYNFPLCVFTSFKMETSYSGEKILIEKPQLLTGRQFLRRYLNRSLKTQGCYGVFDRQYLKRIGGIKKLGKGFGPYSDNLLAIQCGLLKKVVFIDAPLIFFRAHKGSISLVSTDLEAYSSAQEELCRKCIKLFNNKELRDDFSANLFYLLRWCIKDFAAVLRRSRAINLRQTSTYLVFLKRYMGFLGQSVLYWRMIGFLIKTVVRLGFNLGKMKLRVLAEKYSL